MAIYRDEEGRVLNPKFKEIFKTPVEFRNSFKASLIYPSSALFPDTYIDQLFGHLQAYYYNSQIASSDVAQFKLKLFSIMATDGIIWCKKQEVLNKLLTLTEDEIRDGGLSWQNMAMNPGDFQDGKMGSDEFLDFIQNQNTFKKTNSKLDALSVYTYALHNSTKAFIDKFKKLFMTVVDYDYIEYVEDEEV